MNAENIQLIEKKLQALLDNDPKEAGLEGLAVMGIALLLQRVDPKVAIDTNDIVKMVEQFNTKMGVENCTTPRWMPEDQQFRFKHFEEEVKEFRVAVITRNLEKQFDASLDIIYLLLGNMLIQGLPFYEGFKEVHRSNMTKERTAPGKGKLGSTVLKAKGFTKPNLTPLCQ
jgi:predicted HAD superfamily Cof-like phosphohydrolase